MNWFLVFLPAIIILVIGMIFYLWLSQYDRDYWTAKWIEDCKRWNLSQGELDIHLARVRKSFPGWRLLLIFPKYWH